MTNVPKAHRKEEGCRDCSVRSVTIFLVYYDYDFVRLEDVVEIWIDLFVLKYVHGVSAGTNRRFKKKDETLEFEWSPLISNEFRRNVVHQKTEYRDA